MLIPVLANLTVRNLVVVREVDIDFGPGLTVMSGETGAGKSILIEAMGLVLGERADSHLVRAGADKATVTATFDISQLTDVREFLRAQDLDADGECLLRRVVGRDGRSRAFCNAQPVALDLLRRIGELLVDVHAQHAGHRLLQRDVQRELLDGHGGLEAAVTAVQSAHGAWRAARDALEAASAGETGMERIELLRYQAAELLDARFDAAEIDDLENSHKRLAHAAADLEHCAALRHALASEEAGANAALHGAATHARTLARHNGEAAALLELIEQALVTTVEAERELDRLEGAIDVDPARLERLDRRVAELHGLARKHQVTLAELPALLERLEGELARHDARAGQQEALVAAQAQALGEYSHAADSLSKARRRAAARMAGVITERLRALGIPHARFEISLTALAEATPQPHGRDRVEFHVTTNPDQPAGPLAKVASGGELSRIGLAIQAATAGQAGVPVVVYDEVDTGIGGTTANIVGRNLRDVARHCQVICITHSPQVASAGDHHLLVSKSVKDGSTETALTALAPRARETEIARMLGAGSATRSSVAHARDLMKAAHES